ncbi:carboxypeptidase regulatory-like domain-containing protein [Streptomyces sp. NPDC055992]|uniref:carboxypeptidase regulatory-like domain-containing protein n=1 Tax=Streptomyces sp. NPDC055992 TaxID=3345673 RepID=UPI0035D8E7FC
MSSRPDHRPRRSRRRIRTLFAYAAAACFGLGLLSASPAAVAVTNTPAAGTTAADDPTVRPYTPTDCNDPAQKTGYARCLSVVNTPTNQRTRARAATSGPPASALGPAQIQSAYKLPSDGGDGRTVAIVDAFGNSRAEEDLAVFREHYGLPACTTANGCFRKVDQRGGSDYPADDKGWATETSLDLDAVSAACPGCKILLVQSDDNSLENLGASVGTAVRLGAKFVSNSYGIDGEGADQALFDHYYDHPGIVVTVSSGDTGHVQSWPATNPNVVAVGGTRLTASPGTERGWTEAAWDDGGSGCSLYEATPAYQEGIDTGCDTRSTADISAVADPASGLGVYDTVGSDGWLQVGGTSLSAPLVAAMYAQAGDPAAHTYPVTYPYAYTGDSGLNDVTQGTNDTCGDITCTAGPGYDGPTGLGTPNGVSALTLGDSGTFSGRITSGADGGPLAGAVVRAADGATGRSFRTTTDADGRYSLTVRTGTYRVTASLFGYADATGPATEIAKGDKATADLSLTRTATSRVSGKVTDGGEQGWPLSSKITVDGYPGGAVYTDPETGAYSVDLPRGATYSLHATPLYPGYHATDLTVEVGGSDLTRNVASVPDRAACNAPGYGNAAAAGFEGWTGTTPKDGWTVTGTDPAAPGWEFDAPLGIENMTGGSGNFATANSLAHDFAAQDTVLTSPVVDMRGHTAQLDFDSMFGGGDGTAATVEVTVDGGKTWSSVWKADNDPVDMTAGHETVALPQAEGRAQVQIRFHFTSTAGEMGVWQTDSVQLGGCSALTGGLITGIVTDGNTKKPVNGATITDPAAPYAAGHSAATAGDPADRGGRYWLFVPGAGKHTLTVAAPRYATGTHTARITAGRINRVGLGLEAGHVVAKPEVSFDARLGRKATRTITFTNTGKAPVKVNLGEQSTSGKAGHLTGDAAWTSLPDYPEPIMGNAVGTYAGKVYSVGGFDRAVGATLTKHGYVYKPAAGSWRRIADMPEALALTSSAFVDGTLYVAAGQGSTPVASATVLAYHPGTDTWTRAADLPRAVKAAGVAALDGKLYVISGCVDDCGKQTKAVYRYAPASDRWSRVSDYPKALTSAACAGLAGEIVCAGGLDPTEETGVTAAAYAYNPSADSWRRVTDMPVATASAAATGANGRMQVVGGYTQGVMANTTAVEYDPVSGLWSALPDSKYPIYQGGVGCGLYQVGGGQSVRSYLVGGIRAEYLPGYDQCEGDDVSWLSEVRTRFTLKPGHAVTVPVTADAGAVPAAGTYTADLTIGTDSPYTGQAVAITLKAAGRHTGH